MSGTVRSILILHVKLGVGMLWIAMICLALEVAFRGIDTWKRNRAEEIYQRIDAEARTADDHVFAMTAERCPPPDTVPWQAPERSEILTLNENDRQTLARKRNEIIVLCDAEGAVKDVYLCDGRPKLEQIGQRIVTGGNITDLLPPEEGQDALRAIQQSSFEERPIRDYEIPLKDGSVHSVEFNCIQITESPEMYALFLGNSRFRDVYFRYRPHIYRRNWYAGQFTRSEFWTNSLGFRDRDIEVPKPHGLFRILCIGGSTTVEGPHNNLTYPKFLETMLRDHFGEAQIEVINCGVDGAGFRIELERFPEWLALEPDMIIHYNLINNLATIITNAGDTAGLRNGWQGTLRQWGAKSRLLTSLTSAWFWPTEGQFAAHLEETAFSWLYGMHEAASEAGVPFVVASFKVPDAKELPLPEQVFFSKSFHINYIIQANAAYLDDTVHVYNTALRTFCNRHNIFYVPVAENMHGNMANFADICHMRLPGIKEKASIFFEYLAPRIADMVSTLPADLTQN